MNDVAESNANSATGLAGRKRRKVTSYSRLDRERIARGEQPLDLQSQFSYEDSCEELLPNFASNDDRLFADVPPHY